jgi:hypothetical protein
MTMGIVGEARSATRSGDFASSVFEPRAAQLICLLLNRKTGRTFSGTIWDTEGALRRSESAVSSLRDEAAQAVGARGPKVEAFEITFTEILMPVTANR